MMKGKFWSIPIGMAINKKYYCSKCGAVLEKEKTQRVVTKDDVDYYQYHDYGTFPKRDYDVISYRFKCPSCNARISYGEQCIIERIQKKQGRTVLSSADIKANYKNIKDHNNRIALVEKILISIGLILLFFILYFLFGTKRTVEHFVYVSLLFLVFSLVTTLSVVRNHKGTGKMKHRRAYFHEKEAQMERLHSYSSHNNKLVNNADKCYCFYCMSGFDSIEIDSYIDEGQTALCPKCGIDSVIPDNIDEEINEAIILDMNRYWF